MSYHGDIRLGDTIDIQFSTRNTSGVPTTLAGTPAISAYIGNSTTQITAGITLTVDLDTVTGLHNCRVVATSGNGYTTASNVSLVITTGTVGGTSVVGEQIGSFSIENRSAVMPTTAGRTLDVSAGGEAGVDWANVGSPTTSVSLSNTTVATVTTTTTASNVTTLNGIAANVITAASIATDAVAEISDGVWDEGLSGHLGAGSTGEALNAAGAAGDPWTTALPGAYGAGSAGKIIGDNLNATISSRASQTSLDTVDDFLDTEVAAIKAKTDLIPASPASTTNITAGTITTVTNLTNAPTAGDLTATMKASVNAEVLDVLATDTFAEAGSVPAATSSLKDKINWLFALGRNKITQTATTQLVRNDADSGTIGTSTVSDDGTTFTRGEYS